MATITLRNFEQYIPAAVVQRGRQIWKKWGIRNMIEETPGEWTATVEGATGNDYEVYVGLEGEALDHSECTCPYEQGICKHRVAVLFKIKEQLTAAVRPARGSSTFSQARSRAEALALARTERLAHARKIVEQHKQQKTSHGPANKLKSVPVRSVVELFDEYARLSETAERLVKIAAAAWEPLSQTKLAELFNACGFKHMGKGLYTKDLATIMPNLLSTGLVKPSENNYQCNHTFAGELCDRQFSRDADFLQISKALRQQLPLGWHNSSSSPERLFREMRLARYLDKPGDFSHYFYDLIRRQSSEYTQQAVLDFWLPPVFDLEKVKVLPPGIRAFLLNEKLSYQTFHLTPADGYLFYVLEKLPDFDPVVRENLARLSGQLLLLQGNRTALHKILGHFGPLNANVFAGFQHLIAGRTTESVAAFQQAHKELRRESRSPKNVLTNLAGIFQIMAQLKTRDATLFPQMEAHIDQVFRDGTSYLQAFVFLRAALHAVQNNKTAAMRMLSTKQEYSFPLIHCFKYLCQFWVEPKSIDRKELAEYHELLRQNGYDWLAAEMLALRAELDTTDLALRTESEQQIAALQIEPLAHLLPRVEAWENALNMLTGMANRQAPTARENDARLAWFVDFEQKSLQPKEQSFGKKGWTAGRIVPDFRLRAADLPCMTEQDKRIAQALEYGSYYYLHKSLPVWKAMAGHPLLFLAKSPEVAVELTEEQPTLITQKVEGGFRLRFSHVFETEGFQIVKETPTRYKLVIVGAEQAKIAQMFDGSSLFIPEKAADRLNAAMTGLAQRIPVQSVFEEEHLPEVPADARVCLHLLPVGDGFHVELYAKPFTDTPPYFEPGAGEPSAVTLVGGLRVRTVRDLELEKANVALLLAEVEILRSVAPLDKVWTLENAQQCLELLTQIHTLVQNKGILLEWPKGEKFKVSKVAGFDQFAMRIRGENNWFEVEGELRVDENRVLTLQELLALSASGNRFVEIGPGQFIALTNEFRRRLRQIDGLMSARKGGALQLHPLAAGALEAFTELVQDAEFDQKFKENREKLRAAFEVKYPLPKKFNAQLRPYQQEGFEWLSRCAAASLGACLADDMGLGKTIQALALLTTRAKLGPALVVAPASVCRNWMAETQKFAPALRPVLFGEGDRAAVIDQAVKGDLLIVTYDLLARSGDHFVKKQFATVILDEAQFIKNRATKRSETAMQLHGDFRLIMTGTPLENHLGELWNLFQFANPGLLGSIEHFNERFALPIEKYRDEDRREQLRRLVQPFILRRRKDEVLRELPAKTEITLRVPLSPEERVFYEALRRNALEALSADTGAGAGEKHLRILAEIMRLRRAACHPNLADANAGFKSSAKLELFGEIVDELLENGHKALVFSQFVGHLAILETYLKKKKIAYQYLDGQTPLAKRQQSIEAFQAGQGDLFLISLRAGGTGLNLTAADYVIHTDPWWNPAVEDQATDRAHRIGQEKPVTVYRLVAEQTIEEKILLLHAQKRDLADSLLSGADVSAKLTAEELLALIAEV